VVVFLQKKIQDPSGVFFWQLLLAINFFRDVFDFRSGRVEILVTPRGNKNQFGISWKGHFAGVEFDTGVVDEKLISGATKHYDAWP